MFRIISLFLLLFSFLLSSEFFPNQKWYEYETKNFRLYFNDNTKYLADEAYDIVEKIYEDIASQMGYYSREKVYIVFNDKSDLIMAYADYFSNFIMINTAKIKSSEIGPFSKSQLHNLITHELTHIIHLQISTISDELFLLTKRTTAKGWLYPYFMVEGIAIYNEKYLSKGGRLYNNSFQEQIMSFVKEKNFPALSQMSQRSIIRWPMGHTPYLLGALFVDYLVHTYGMEDLISSFRYFGGKIDVDYQESFNHIYGITLQKAYEDFIDYYNNMYLKKKNHNGYEENNSYRKFFDYDKNIEVKSFFYNDDNSFYVMLNDFRSSPKIIFVTSQNSIEVYNDPLLYGKKIQVINNDIYFTKLNFPNIYENKILLVRLTKDKEQIIDEGIVDFSGNKESLVYIKKSLGIDHIVFQNNEKNQKEIIYSSKNIESISLANSSNKFAFIEAKNTNNVLVVYQNGNFTEIISGDIKDVFYHEEELYFTASYEGLSQLFRYDKNNNNIYLLTKVLTGVYNPQIVSDNLLFITYTSTGTSLVSQQIKEETIISKSKISIQFLEQNSFTWTSKDKTKKEEINPSEDNAINIMNYFDINKKREPIRTSKEYNVWSLKMLYLYPFVYFDNLGYELGISTFLKDPLSFNQFLINFYASNRGEFYNIQYFFAGFYPFFTINANKDGYNDFFLAGMEFPFRQNLIQQKFFVGLKDFYANNELIHNFYSFSYLISSLEKYPYSVSYENGYFSKVNIDFSRKYLRASYYIKNNLYLPGFYLNHVIKASLDAGYSRDMYYKLTGIPGSNYVRGLDITQKLQGSIMGKLTLEYRFPLKSEDKMNVFGFYHKHTAMSLFYDVADAVDSRNDFMKKPFWSSGASLEFSGEFSNFYPLSLGIGIAKTVNKEFLFFFSFGNLPE
jgi:hypothetical protein